MLTEFPTVAVRVPLTVERHPSATLEPADQKARFAYDEILVHLVWNRWLAPNNAGKMEFIELQRRFRRVTDSELEDATESFVYWDRQAFGPGIGWPDLLEHRRTVLLAEAGAGKTTEMDRRAKRLVDEGRVAFFLPLESLDQEPVVDMLSSAEKERFIAWKADHRAPAWFFLDAVDELKLTKGKLDRALRRVSQDIDDHIQRARIIISCRPSDWRPVTDLATVKRWLPILTQGGEDGPVYSDDFFISPLERDHRQTSGSSEENVDAATSAVVETVAMLPMNDDQIKRFAEQAGVTDVTGFLQEIRRQNAWTFAGRPLDLSDLIGTWRSSRRLGTRSEQHETNVKGKLRDDPGRRDHGVLNDTKAQLGAERLALALALTRMRSIRSPEQAPDIQQAGEVLDAADILLDWTEEERQALLRRALFDPATYGRIRFHHRSVQEYLAARHLRTLRGQGMATRELLRFLFAERYGVEIVFPSMRAIAAWLALWDGAVRKELIKREPEALLLEGDPETLDLATKSDLLQAFVVRYGHGSWHGFRFEIDQLRRLAQPELAPVIRKCWGNGPVNDDVRHLLVRIIWLGPVPDCADLAHSVAFDTSWSDSDRIVAVRALVACGWESAVREVADDMLAYPESWSERVVHEVTGDLFPTVLTVDELITLMERTPEPKNTGSGFEWTSLEIVKDLDHLCELAVSLRDKLATVVWEGRAERQDFHEIRGRLHHLAPALAVLCERQLASASSRYDAALIRCCVIASRFSRGKLSARESVGRIRKRCGANAALRRDVFWAELAFMDNVVPVQDDGKRFSYSLHGSLIGSLIEADQSWLTEALADESRPERRAVALHAIMKIWSQRGGIRSELEVIRAELKGDRKLGRLLEEHTARRKRSNKIMKMERKHRRRELAQARGEERLLDNWKKWRDELLADPVKAFSPERQGATVDTLYEWLSKYKRGSNRWNIWDKEALSEAFGQEVADLAETAFRMLWRNERPVLWGEWPAAARGEIPRQWIHGLLGVSAEASTPGWTTSLSSDEARKAAAYATIELGGFAPFIADLAKSHPAEVNEVIGGEVSAEISVGGDGTYLPALQHLTGADGKLKQLLIPRLLDELKSWPGIVTDETGPRWAQHLDSVLAILGEATSVADREAIAQECRKRYETDPVGPLALVWLKGLFRFDALRGTQMLTETLADRDDVETRKRAEKVFAKLFGERDAVVFEIADSAQYAQILGQLVRLSHAFVSPKDDQVRDGVYSPDARDHAQRVRHFLFSSLLDTPGPEARSVVLELAGEDDFADIQDYIRLHARQRTAEDAEFASLTPKEVTALENRHEAPPQDRNGLFDIMMDRLDDIALDLAGGDFTDRPTIQRITKESEMQRVLARRLIETANGAYLVTREEEVVDQKYPDIRLSTVKGNQKAVVEVKIVDNDWTLKKLERALRNQLVRQYLRDAKCKTGCLLLTYHGRKKYWKHPHTGKRLNFDDLVTHLKDRAGSLQEEGQPDVLVTVFGLDLTDPNSQP